MKYVGDYKFEFIRLEFKNIKQTNERPTFGGRTDRSAKGPAVERDTTALKVIKQGVEEKAETTIQ